MYQSQSFETNEVKIWKYVEFSEPKCEPESETLIIPHTALCHVRLLFKNLIESEYWVFPFDIQSTPVISKSKGPEYFPRYNRVFVITGMKMNAFSTLGG